MLPATASRSNGRSIRESGCLLAGRNKGRLEGRLTWRILSWFPICRTRDGLLTQSWQQKLPDFFRSHPQRLSLRETDGPDGSWASVTHWPATGEQNTIGPECPGDIVCTHVVFKTWRLSAHAAYRHHRNHISPHISRSTNVPLIHGRRLQSADHRLSVGSWGTGLFPCHRTDSGPRLSTDRRSSDRNHPRKHWSVVAGNMEQMALAELLAIGGGSPTKRRFGEDSNETGKLRHVHSRVVFASIWKIPFGIYRIYCTEPPPTNSHFQ